MIRINLLDQRPPALKKAMAAAEKAIRSRSFADRNPQLGKMINCPVCDRRHRGSICTPQYATVTYELTNGEEETVELFASPTKKKPQKLVHPSKYKLQLVQLTQRLFPLHAPYLTDPVECMKASRNDAYRIIIKGIKLASKLYRGQRRVANQINQGLATPVTRFIMPELRSVSTETRNKRQDKNKAAAERNKAAREAASAGSQ
jgi:hypothetical protein